jgi:hypothetical protein
VEVGIQHNPVNAVIAAGQQILVAVAQRVGHVLQLITTHAAATNPGF